MSEGGVSAGLSRRLDSLLRGNAFPRAFQVALLVTAVAIVLLATRRPLHSEMNTGAALIWQIWWPILPFSTLFFSRLWCAVCPFSLISDLGANIGRSVAVTPSSRLRHLMPWFATAGLLLLGVAFLVSSLESNGTLTAVLLGLFGLAALATGTLWQGKVWCRYLCPVGLMTGLYSRLGLLRLTASSREAKVLAVRAARNCPMHTSPASARASQNCLLCGSCVREPEGRAIEVRIEFPASLGPRLTLPESLAAMLLFGLLLVDVLRMTPLYLSYMARAVPAFGGRYELAMVLGMMIVLALVLLVLATLALTARGESSFSPTFASLGLVVIPLVLAVQLGLSAQHLMVTGEVIRNLGAELSLVEPGHIPPVDAYSWLWPLKAVQLLLLLGGAWVGLRAARRASPAGRTGAAGVASLAPLLVVLFTQPMSVSC